MVSFMIWPATWTGSASRREPTPAALPASAEIDRKFQFWTFRHVVSTDADVSGDLRYLPIGATVNNDPGEPMPVLCPIARDLRNTTSRVGARDPIHDSHTIKDMTCELQVPIRTGSTGSRGLRRTSEN